MENPSPDATEEPDADTPIYKKLSMLQKVAYSVGIIFNSMCTLMWGSYMLIYYKNVQKIDDKYAGGLVLLGQSIVAVAAPLIGYLGDKGKKCCPYGSLKMWHGAGTILVAIVFPFIFMKCFICETASQSVQFGYYAFFTIIFKFGWCAAQITHLALISDLATVASERVELSALRYCLMVVSSICVYVIMWIFLKKAGGSGKVIDTRDAYIFQDVALIIVGFGLFFSLLFFIFLREKNGPNDKDGQSQLKWFEWFKEPQFYMVLFVYLSTKLYFTVGMIYLPFYIEDSLRLSKDMIAIIPLIMLSSGLISSFTMKYMTMFLGNKLTFFIGCVFGLAACFWILFGQGDAFRFQHIYIVAVFMGLAHSVLFVISLAMISDLIGTSTTSSTFVYGFMAFIDRISNGIAVVVISNIDPCGNSCESFNWYYRNIMSYACGLFISVSLIGLGILCPQNIGIRALSGTAPGLYCTD